MTKRQVFVPGESGPGFTTGAIVTIDDSIHIDDYIPSQPHLLWYCDHCGEGHPVTAEFTHGDGLTLCINCLQNAINGIRASLANPKAPEDV